MLVNSIEESIAMDESYDKFYDIFDNDFYAEDRLITVNEKNDLFGFPHNYPAPMCLNRMLGIVGKIRTLTRMSEKEE